MSIRLRIWTVVNPLLKLIRVEKFLDLQKLIYYFIRFTYSPIYIVEIYVRIKFSLVKNVISDTKQKKQLALLTIKVNKFVRKLASTDKMN